MKFLLAARSTASTLAALRSLCRPDGRHPENDVVTIYYDTADLTSLGDRLDSQRFKTKLRLRWYEEEAGDNGSDRGFLELKFRIGSQRRKLRLETPYRVAWLEQTPLDDVELLRAPGHLRPQGLIPPSGVRPVLAVRYRRCRFVEPFTGSRISLDWGVRTARVNPQLLPAAPRTELGLSVLEVKNGTGELPPTLEAPIFPGGRRSSFSKYSACYEQAAASSVLAA